MTVFQGLMQKPPRRWNPFHWSITKSEFTDRLAVAEAGGLVPVDHVKDMQRGWRKSVPLFEIRWDFNVLTEQDAVKRYETVHFRMYHSEPASLPDRFVGLHMHEKIIVPNDDYATGKLQDIEIDQAVSRHKTGINSTWGVG